MKITTYHNPNEKHAWVALVELPPRLYMPFFGPTEEMARMAAENWFQYERQRKIVGSVATEVATTPDNRTGYNPGGRGTQFIGKVWMLNRQTGERARIDVAEISQYEARGYVKGGPRSK